MNPVTDHSVLALAASMVFAAVVLVGCDGRSAAAPNPPSTDLVKLGQLINLPEGVESAEWTTIEMPGGNDWRLLARLVVSADLVHELQNKGDRLGERITSVENAEWFARGVNAASPVEHYKPDIFARSPLLHGWTAVPKEDVVLLWLETH